MPFFFLFLSLSLFFQLLLLLLVTIELILHVPLAIQYQCIEFTKKKVAKEDFH